MTEKETVQFVEAHRGEPAIGIRYPFGGQIRGRLTASGTYIDENMSRRPVLYIDECRVLPETVEIVDEFGRFSLPEDATDPRFTAVTEVRAVKPVNVNYSEIELRTLAELTREHHRVVEKLHTHGISRVIDVALAPGQVQLIASDTAFLGHVDELLRWAQGHTDRDLVRDRVCRALGPLLRERMGRKPE